MRRHPIEQHADAGIVAAVDEQREFLGRAEQRVRGELAQRLVAPRPSKRMRHHRQEFDMGKTHAGHVVDQLLGKFAPVERAPVGMTHPRAGMYFVDRDRRVGGLAARPLRTPCVVRPAERRGIVDDRCGGGRRLDPPGDRIGLHRQQRAVRSKQLVLIERSGREAWNKNLPHSRLVAQPHRVASPVPGVEVADDGNPPRIWRPHGKAHPRYPIDHQRMRAKAGS